ncbi:MAG: hypothetical protein VYB54_00315 [Pseudomonadota bacterium]|nr:hypothetical protein [Pseudomonadota bacterium]
MSRAKRRSKSSGGGRDARHLRLYHYVIESEAWRDLSPGAKALYTGLAYRYNGSNNGEIPYSCREAAAYLNVSKNTASRLFNELVDHGFASEARSSSFDLKTREARLWRLHDPFYGRDHSDSGAFLRWRKSREQPGATTGKIRNTVT